MLYKEASRVIQSTQEKKSTVKNLVLSSKFKNKKQLYALVCETLKFKDILTSILETTQLQKREKILRQDSSLVLVLLYDFLVGKGLHGPNNKFKEAVLKHKAALQSELARLKVKVKSSKNEDLLRTKVRDEVAVPRYVRVNTLKTSVPDVIEHFRREDYIMVSTVGLSYDRYISVLRGLEPHQFTQDRQVPELLVFAAGTDLHDHVLYRSGDIILQDKASCLPAFVLSPRPGCHVIDCCAAPGNKTSHLAAILGNKGKLFAFDKDMKRAATLSTQLLKAGVLCAEVKHADFLSVNTADPKYREVECVLVDPSCSGSGIVNRMNEVTDDQDSSSMSRLHNLAKFQVAILSHAMTFSKVTKVVYSTCSTHQTENEAVVREAINVVDNTFEVVSVLKDLPHRGQQLSHDRDFPARKCVRLSPDADLTNGFFIASLRRKQGVEDGTVVKRKGAEWKSGGKPKPNPVDECWHEEAKYSDHSSVNKKRMKQNSENKNPISDKDCEKSQAKAKKRQTKKGEPTGEVVKQNQSSDSSKSQQEQSKKKKKMPNKVISEEKGKTGTGVQNNEVILPSKVVFQVSKSNKQKKKHKHRKHKPVTR